LIVGKSGVEKAIIFASFLTFVWALNLHILLNIPQNPASDKQESIALYGSLWAIQPLS